MWQKLSIVFALSGLLASTAFGATVTVVVDDKASDDSAYVNGTGGNFSGASGLKDAIAAINADATADATFQVNLIDTDGTSDTYTGDVMIDKPHVTIAQVANGNNNDSTITITGDGSITGDTQFKTNAMRDYITIQGLSASKPLVFQSQGGRWALFMNATNFSTVQNVRFIGTGGSLHYVGINNTIESCQFMNTGGWVIFLEAGDNTELNNCIFKPAITNGDFQLMPWMNHINFNNCTFYMSPGPNHLGGSGTKTITFNDCSWYLRVGGGSGNFINNFNADGSTYIFNRPKFLSTMPGTHTGFIDPAQTEANVYINGTPAQKCDLTIVRPAGELFARMMRGKIAFTDCIINGWRIDAEGNKKDSGGALLADKWAVEYNFNRCQVTNAEFGAIGTAWPARKFIANNSVFSRTDGNFLYMGWACGGQGGTVLNHCTLMSGTGTLMMTEASDNTTATYTAFKGNTGAIFDNGKMFGKTNVVFGSLFPSGKGTNNLTNTFTEDPKLDANGVPQAGSSVINRAVPSTETVDYLGAARPQGFARDIGAYETALVPVEMSNFSIQ